MTLKRLRRSKEIFLFTLVVSLGLCSCTQAENHKGEGATRFFCKNQLPVAAHVKVKNSDGSIWDYWFKEDSDYIYYKDSWSNNPSEDCHVDYTIKIYNKSTGREDVYTKYSYEYLENSGAGWVCEQLGENRCVHKTLKWKHYKVGVCDMFGQPLFGPSGEKLLPSTNNENTFSDDEHIKWNDEHWGYGWVETEGEHFKTKSRENGYECYLREDPYGGSVCVNKEHCAIVGCFSGNIIYFSRGVADGTFRPPEGCKEE